MVQWCTGAQHSTKYRPKISFFISLFVILKDYYYLCSIGTIT